MSLENGVVPRFKSSQQRRQRYDWFVFLTFIIFIEALYYLSSTIATRPTYSFIFHFYTFFRSYFCVCTAKRATRRFVIQFSVTTINGTVY